MTPSASANFEAHADLRSLAPYRELAFQIGEQFRALGGPMGLRDVVVVGGVGEPRKKELYQSRPSDQV